MALVLLVLTHSTSARSEPTRTLSGQWTASAMNTRWAIGDWGAACGPRPSGGGAPGGPVTVAQQGSELTITGAGRSYSTTRCWEQYFFPGLARTSHSGGQRGWANTCQTPAGDSRQATVKTIISATDTYISFNETAQYQFLIQGQNCTASVRRSRSFKLVARAGEAPKAAPEPAASAEPEPEPAPKPEPEPVASPKTSPGPTGDCATPGPVARLELSPSRRVARPGSTAAFRARLLDRNGCALGERPSLRVRGALAGVIHTGGGVFQVAHDAAEGTLKLEAQHDGKRVVAELEVVARHRYDELLKSGAVDHTGASPEAAVTSFASSDVGSDGGQARVQGTPLWLSLTIVGALAALFGGIGILLLRQARRRAVAETMAPPPLEPAATEGPATETRPPSAAPPPPAPAGPDRLCPICGSRFGPDVKFCGHDGAATVPVN